MSAATHYDCLVCCYWQDRIEEYRKHSRTGCSETLLNSRQEHARLALTEHLERAHNDVSNLVNEGNQ